MRFWAGTFLYAMWSLVLTVSAITPLQARDNLVFNVSDFVLKDLELDESGFLRNISSDGYMVLPDLNRNRANACALQFDVEFAEPLQRPALFDVFWRSSGGFSESMKAFFLIDYADSKVKTRFVLPLCKLYHYSGNTNRGELQKPLDAVRFDFPGNRSIGLKFHSFEMINAQAMREAMQNENVVMLEPFERVSAAAFTSLDVVIPKLLFALEDGLKKLRADRVFVIVWLLLILCLLTLIVRSFMPRSQ